MLKGRTVAGPALAASTPGVTVSTHEVDLEICVRGAVLSPPLASSLLLLKSRVPLKPARGSGERCKLPGAPAENEFGAL